ncbi:PAS domain-containing protein [Roseomonas sp. M0104]|uniref:PAS domain-containing protein n=2 Tax=Teichococcus coralli TaxID=2545983 RepID=A0A845BJ98_9PROT|nr:PAS domain-containing protein [Pseudoroseomonas coralli]MXP65252.1 PAS domain-containing protein [Pseudoroseomonas coralli]
MAARAGRVAAGRFAAGLRAGALEWAGKPLEEVILGERRAPPARPDPLLGLAQIAEAVMLTAADLDLSDPPIVFVNARFERMTGWSRAEIPGRSPRVRQGPRTDPGARRALDRHACRALDLPP